MCGCKVQRMGNGVMFQAVVAILVGLVVSVLMFVPFVALSYRRRGSLSAGRMLAWLAAVFVTGATRSTDRVLGAAVVSVVAALAAVACPAGFVDIEDDTAFRHYAQPASQRVAGQIDQIGRGGPRQRSESQKKDNSQPAAGRRRHPTVRVRAGRIQAEHGLQHSPKPSVGVVKFFTACRKHLLSRTGRRF